MRDLHRGGWKALVAELGVANATRFVMELHEGEQDYSKLRGELFADKTLDQLYSEIKSANCAKRSRKPPAPRRHR